MARDDGSVKFADGLPTEMQNWADDLFDAVKETPLDIVRAGVVLEKIKVIRPLCKGRPDLRAAAIEAVYLITRYFDIKNRDLTLAKKLQQESGSVGPGFMGGPSCSTAH